MFFDKGRIKNNQKIKIWHFHFPFKQINRNRIILNQNTSFWSTLFMDYFYKSWIPNGLLFKSEKLYNPFVQQGRAPSSFLKSQFVLFQANNPLELDKLRPKYVFLVFFVKSLHFRLIRRCLYIWFLSACWLLLPLLLSIIPVVAAPITRCLQLLLRPATF